MVLCINMASEKQNGSFITYHIQNCLYMATSYKAFSVLQTISRVYFILLSKAIISSCTMCISLSINNLYAVHSQIFISVKKNIGTQFIVFIIQKGEKCMWQAIVLYDWTWFFHTEQLLTIKFTSELLLSRSIMYFWMSLLYPLEWFPLETVLCF